MCIRDSRNTVFSLGGQILVEKIIVSVVSRTVVWLCQLCRFLPLIVLGYMVMGMGMGLRVGNDEVKGSQSS